MTGPIRRSGCTWPRRSARHGMEIPYPHRQLVRPKPAQARHAREAAERGATLAKLDLFVPLTSDEREALAGNLADFPFVAHDVIARQGEPADSLFILARGRVAVFDDSAGGTGVRDRLATLSAPAYFGEMGLLTGQARGATVVAEDEVLCYRLQKDIVRRHPACAPGARRAAVAGRRGPAGGERREAAVALGGCPRQAGGRAPRGPRPPDQGILRAGLTAAPAPAIARRRDPRVSAGRRCPTTTSSRATRTAGAETRAPRPRDCGPPRSPACRRRLRKRGACSRIARTASSPSSPPASARRGSWRYSAGRSFIATFVT